MSIHTITQPPIIGNPQWQPVKHTVVKDSELTEILHTEGIAKKPFVSPEQIAALRALYEEDHDVQNENGGMFYSVYSQDFAYRKKVHEQIKEILRPSFEKYFKDYQDLVNMFIVKVPGPASEFFVHQDTTAIDETKHSPLSVWLPLHDIDESNGALCVIPKSQWFFSPYRGISYPYPFQEIVPTLRLYLEPQYMKAGEALIFDPRIVHNSLPNISDKPRIAVVAGIFPPDIDILTCYRDMTQPDAKIEFFKQEQDYLLKFDEFLHNCMCRPSAGHVIGEVEADFPELMTEDEFVAMCERNGIQPKNLIPEDTGVQCHMIGEPDGTTPDFSEKEMAQDSGSVHSGLNMFKDPEMNAEMEEKGYIKLPFLSAEEIEHFKKLYKQYHPTDPEFFYKSYFSPDEAYKKHVEDEIIEAFKRKLGHYFHNYYPLGGMFVSKPPGEKGHFPLHQDWSFVDENKSWSINMWAPLEDVNDANGNIEVIPGSHKFNETIRGSGTPDTYNHLTEVTDQFKIPVPMKAGEALFFFHGLLHGSTPNTTEKTRVSVGLSIMPKNVPLLYHYMDPDDPEQKLERYLANEEFYRSYVSHREKRPSNLESLGVVDFGFPRLTKEEFYQKCGVDLPKEEKQEEPQEEMQAAAEPERELAMAGGEEASAGFWGRLKRLFQ